MSNNFLSVGNITTIINTAIVIIAGFVFGFLTSMFGGLPVNEAQFTSLLSAIVFAIFGYVNAKNHNTFWDKTNDTINIPVDLTDEQKNLIQTIIDNTSVNVAGKTFNKYNDAQLEEIDPAGEYDDI